MWSVLWLASAHALPPNSDGATVLLEVRALARGNLLLHGWRLSLNWFWAVDAPFSALAYLLVGLRPALPHVVPGLWALLVFWGLRRGRFGWGWVLAMVLFAAGMTGDLMIVAYGTGGVPQALESVHVAEAAVLVVCLALSVVRLITGVLTGGVDLTGAEHLIERSAGLLWPTSPCARPSSAELSLQLNPGQPEALPQRPWLSSLATLLRSGGCGHRRLCHRGQLVEPPAVHDGGESGGDKEDESG